MGNLAQSAQQRAVALQQMAFMGLNVAVATGGMIGAGVAVNGAAPG